MVRKTLIALAAALSMFSISMATQAFATNGVPTAPVDISLPGGEANNPEVKVASNGLAIALWTRFNGVNYIIQSSTSLNGGTWSTPVNLSANGADAYSPRLVIDSSGRATAVWSRDNGSNLVVQSSTSLNGGAWSSPVDLSAPGADSQNVEVSVTPSGLAVAVWTRSLSGVGDFIQTSTSLNGGSWSSPANLTASGDQAGPPQVSVDANGLTTGLWSFWDGSNYRLQARTSLNGGSWSTPVYISTTGGNIDYSVVTSDATGRATAVWLRDEAGNRFIQASSSLNGGTWSTPVNLSASGQPAANPRISYDSSGRATAAWERSDGSNAIIQTSNSLNGGTWSTPVNLSAAGQNSRNPQISSDSSGLTTVVWARGTSSNRIIQSSSSVNGGAWSTPEDLSASGANANNPQISVSATGLAVIVWARGAGTSRIVQSSTIDNPIAPSPTPTQSPTPELANTGVNLYHPGLLFASATVLFLLGIGGILFARQKKELK